MFLFATLWAAALNLLLLAAALAWTPAFWSNAAHWLQALPWRSFGTQALALLQMQAMDASAVWALWLIASAVLLLGALASYALLKLQKPRAPLPAVAPLPTPEVSAMFDQLSSSLQGLQGFGDLGSPPQAPPMSVPVLTVLAEGAPTAASSAIAASLQEIDPELGTSYAALLRELNTASPNPRTKD